MAFPDTMRLEDVFESFNAAEELFSKNLEESKSKGNTIEVARNEGALEAIQWLKRDNQYELWKVINKRRRNLEG